MEGQFRPVGKPLHVNHPPPPRRLVGLTTREYDLRQRSFFERAQERTMKYAEKGFDKSIVVGDWAGNTVNGLAEYYFGLERFMPVSGDMRLEMEKSARILKMFTIDGIPDTQKKASKSGKKIRSFLVHKKIPREVIQNCAGLIIYSSMRMGQLISGGSGGSGIIIAHLGEGQWSAPSAILPNDMSFGFVLGVDFLEAVIVIKTKEAMEAFLTHNITLGGDLDCAAGPYGGLGASAEVSWRGGPPVLSYVRSRGYYAGIDLKGQIFMERFDENERQYYWPGVRARQILAGQVDFPIEGADLKRALLDAEFAERTPEVPEELDVDPSEMGDASLQQVSSLASDLNLEEGEVLKLPPTPLQKLTSEQYGADDDDPAIVSIRPPSKTFASEQLSGPPVPARRRPVSSRTSLVEHAKVVSEKEGAKESAKEGTKESAKEGAKESAKEESKESKDILGTPDATTPVSKSATADLPAEKHKKPSKLESLQKSKAAAAAASETAEEDSPTDNFEDAQSADPEPAQDGALPSANTPTNGTEDKTPENGTSTPEPQPKSTSRKKKAAKEAKAAAAAAKAAEADADADAAQAVPETADAVPDAAVPSASAERPPRSAKRNSLRTKAESVSSDSVSPKPQALDLDDVD